MNDFTKEELYFLRDYTTHFINNYDSENAPEVLDKIQSMIDNYCEHEFIATVGRPMSTPPGWYDAVVKCARCGALPRTTK